MHLSGRKPPSSDATWPAAPARVDAAPPALVLEGITRRYGSAAVVDGLSLTVARGEIVALVGHSGSGKSTLLRIVAGLERPQAGTVLIDGREIFGPHVHVPTERRGVGMMFQDYALFPHLSVLDNVRFGVRGAEAAETRARATAALDRVGMASHADAYPHVLSGGEQQRVALVRALLPGPRLLLMDEPFSNLDRRNRDTIRDQTARILRDSGTTVIVVTHEPEDAMRMTDRILLLQEGRVAQDGPAEELYRNPASLMVARFFSEFNEIGGIVEGGMVATRLGAFPAPGHGDGTLAVVCIRPHDIAVDDDADDRLHGTVTARSFVGDEQMFSLWVPGLELPLQVRAPMHVEAAVGARIGFRLHDENALVFKAVD